MGIEFFFAGAASEEELGSEDDARESDEDWNGELYDTGEGRGGADGKRTLGLA